MENNGSICLVQHKAPEFKATAVLDSQFIDVSLDDYQGKWVCLFFYPLDFTFVCPTEIIAFSDHVDDFKKLNCDILGASVDSQFSHLAWLNTPRNKGGLGHIQFPLLADINKSIAKDYQVLSKEGIALRGLFLINPDGVVAYQVIHDLPVGRSVKETLRVLEAFQTHEKTGEVCPANWNKDDHQTTIKPDPEGSKEYFSKVK